MYANPLQMTQADLEALDKDELLYLLNTMADTMAQDRQHNAILYYKPASAMAETVHKSKARVIGVGGGNGSSKTETCLVEIIACATGFFPECMREDIEWKFKGPIRVRIIVQSLTTTLGPIIFPKLQYFKWTGLAPIGGQKGHFGWIPSICLRNGSWDESYLARDRILTIACHDPHNTDKKIGESTIQFMAHNQEPQDFASGDFDIVMYDEPPSQPIYTENEARTMRVGGRQLLAMTWPDDPAIPMDWLYDDVYARGAPGSSEKRADYDWIELLTTENRNLDQIAIAKQMDAWTPNMINVRIRGKPIRFANRIHPLFTDAQSTYCFNCKKDGFFPEIGERPKCPECHSTDIETFIHVQDFVESSVWPTVFVIDPHPRKPNMFLWCHVDPSDDLWVVADGEMNGSPEETRDEVFRIEEELKLKTVMRLMDPNMGASPGSAKTREITWQEEFANVGLPCILADDSSVGRKRINELLRPDEHTRSPRLMFHPRCTRTIFQFKRYTWDEYKIQAEKPIKEVPRATNDDYPTMLKYLVNYGPTFAQLNNGFEIINPRRKRK